MFSCEPNNSKIENIDPVQKMWMFYSWLEDKNDQYELAKNLGYLIGSFTNPEAVKQAMGQGMMRSSSSYEEFEELSKNIVERNRKEEEILGKSLHRRKRKNIKG